MSNKKSLLVILLTAALILSGCGMKNAGEIQVDISQPGGISSTKNSYANTGRPPLSNQITGRSNGRTSDQTTDQDAAQSTKTLRERLAELNPPVPERPGPVATPDVQPTCLDDHENIPDSKLPRVDITLPDDYALTKSDYTAGTISISNAGDNDLPAAAGQVRIRGNSTADARKKALKIKFDSKQGVFGRNPEKSWTLLANCFDLTGIHNYVSYSLYDRLTPEGTFSPLCEFVDVYVNGAYQGVYNLCDQVETGKGRVPISGKPGKTPETSDYLIEEDFRVPTEEPDSENLEWFWLDWVNHAYKVKSPEVKDGLTEEHTAYIKNYLEDVYAAIRLKDWEAIESLVDVDSFIIGQSVAEITKNYDIFQASLFMYKPADGKLTFGPVWDFDTSFGSCPLGEEGYPNGYATALNPFFGGLMNVPEYHERYIAYFNEHKKEMVSYINSTIDRVDSFCGENLENDFQNWASGYMWYGIPEMQKLYSHAEQTAYMKQWLTERVEWLSKYYK